MSNVKNRTFQHAGKTYEIRAYSANESWIVRVFQDGKPANPFIYSVKHETNDDALTSGAGNLADSLMDTAEADVKRDLVGQLREADKQV